MKIDRFVAINVPAAAAASRALARMTRRKAVVKLRDAKLIASAEDARGLDAEAIEAGVCISITGGLEGAAILCFPETEAAALGGILVGNALGDPAPSKELDESALKELGNVICGNYVSTLSNRMRLKLVPGLPLLARGTCASLLEAAVAPQSLDARAALLIDVELDLPAEVVMGHLLLYFRTDGAIEAGSDAGPAR